MPIQPFKIAVSDFKGLNLQKSENELDIGEAAELINLDLANDGKMVLAKDFNQLISVVSVNMIVWASGNDEWNIVVIYESAGTTYLRRYYGANWASSETFTLSNNTDVHSIFVPLGEVLRIGIDADDDAFSDYEIQKQLKYWKEDVTHSNIAANGDFVSDTIWSKGTGWSIAAGMASCDGSQVADSDLSQTRIMNAETWEVTFTVSAYVAGNVRAVIGGTLGTQRSADGTYTELITSVGSDIIIRADSNFNGNVDKVLVKHYRPSGYYLDSIHLMKNSNLRIESVALNGTASNFVEDDSVQYATSYFMDDGQESLLRLADTVAPDEDNGVDIYVSGAVSQLWTVKAIKLYRSLNDGEFYLLETIELESNSYPMESGGNVAWLIQDNGDILTKTYAGETGYADFDLTIEDNTLSHEYRAATVCQGRMVHGNVRRRISDLLYTQFKPRENDRLYFSEVGKYDSFYKNNYIDIEIGDGDAIVALESLGGEVLIFKENNLYIWDMSSRSALQWRLKARYNALGVAKREHITKSSIGILFWNNTGLYLYNGKIQELGANKVRDAIRVLDGDELAVAYDIVNNSALIAMSGIGAYAYNINLDNGKISKRFTVGASDLKNISYYIDGAIFARTASDIIQLNADVTPTLDTEYKTGKLYFGTHSRKKLTKIKIGYKHETDVGGNAISVWVNGDLIGQLSESASWTEGELYPNVYDRYIQLRITSASDTKVLEIGKIEIEGKIYRR